MKALPGLLLLALNVVGVAVYLALAMGGWRDAAEGGTVPITGEPFVWAVCLPVLFTFILVNMIWGVLLVIWKLKQRWPYIATALIWVGALVVDFSRH